MVDVRKYKPSPKRITNDELQQRGDSYTGIVSEIDEKKTWNSYTLRLPTATRSYRTGA